ncbi:MAG: hypothetical protein ACI361_00595 [Atopobiaceae bacterium]
MDAQKSTFDRRDIVSLVLMLLLIAAAIVYWCCFAGQAGVTYNAFPDALYRYLTEPLMLGSAAFFLASHLHAHVHARDASVHAAKIVCLLLAAVYIVCLATVIAFRTAMAYELFVGVIGYMQAFQHFAPVFIGAVLGIRPSQK